MQAPSAAASASERFRGRRREPGVGRTRTTGDRSPEKFNQMTEFDRTHELWTLGLGVDPFFKGQRGLVVETVRRLRVVAFLRERKDALLADCCTGPSPTSRNHFREVEEIREQRRFVRRSACHRRCPASIAGPLQVETVAERGPLLRLGAIEEGRLF
jgi:hypothetical protein